MSALFLIPSKLKKAGRFEKMLHFDSIHLIVTRGSRAPPYHTLPAFVDPNGRHVKPYSDIVSDCWRQASF